MKTKMNQLIATGVFSAAWLFTATSAFAHCDTMDGPVIADAQFAIEKKEIMPVLKCAPYTGLKPAGTKLDPAIEAADRALDSGKSDALIKAVTDETAAGIRKRFANAMEKKQLAAQNIEAGREYVAAYVEFVHYVEAAHTTATRAAHAHAEPAIETTKSPQEHAH